jgi:hypothetical protein
MDTNNFPSDETRTATTTKKPYEKPSFRYEKVFVTTALHCSKIGNEGNCAVGGLSAS